MAMLDPKPTERGCGWNLHPHARWLVPYLTEPQWDFLTLFLFIFPFLILLFRATPIEYGGSQAKGLIRAVATGLYQSHSNEGSEPRLQPTPQLTAMLDP